MTDIIHTPDTSRKDEMLPLVDEQGNVTGTAPRSVCHGGSKLLHPVVHLHIIDGHGHVLLQQRAADKDIQPGKWDTSVGGHVDPGETLREALLRESREELGLHDIDPIHLTRYVFESERERELVDVNYLIVDPLEVRFDPDPKEIQRLQWWPIDQVATDTTGMLTPNFVQEIARIKDMLPRQ